MGIALRRLRPLLPAQAARRGHRRTVVHQRRLPAARPALLPVQRLRPPPAARARLRQPDTRRSCARSTGCRRPAPIAASPRARTLLGGIRWSPAIRRRCTPPASRCAAAPISERGAGPLEHHIVDWPGRGCRAPTAPARRRTRPMMKNALLRRRQCRRADRDARRPVGRSRPHGGALPLAAGATAATAWP